MTPKTTNPKLALGVLNRNGSVHMDNNNLAEENNQERAALVKELVSVWLKTMELVADTIGKQTAAVTLAALKERSPEGPAATRSKVEFADWIGKSPITVDRLVRMGMPFEWIGSSKRFGSAAEEWLKAQGKISTTAVSKQRSSNRKVIVDQDPDPIDITAVAARAGLRVVGGR